MKLSPIEEKLLFRAAKSNRNTSYFSLEDLLREGKEIPSDKYEAAMDCLRMATHNSKDLAFVRACDTLRGKFKAAK